MFTNADMAGRRSAEDLANAQLLKPVSKLRRHERNRSFNTIGTLRNHNRQDHGRPIYCYEEEHGKICPMAFATDHELQLHRRDPHSRAI